MPGQENQNWKTSFNSKEIHNLMRQSVDLLQKDFIQYQGNQQLLMQYVKLQLNMKQQPEGEQRPLTEDITITDDNIKNLEDKANELKHSVKYESDTLRNLRVEPDEIFKKYQPKDKDTPTHTDGH